VNIYLLADGDGWAMIDSGFGNEESIGAWTKTVRRPLRHVKISPPDRHAIRTRPCRPCGLDRRPLQLRASHVAGRYLQSGLSPEPRHRERRNAQRLFFRRHGMDENLTDKLARARPGLSEAGFGAAWHPIAASPRRRGRYRHAALQGHTGGGHALDQVMLYCAADKLFLSADQLLSKISRTSASWAVEPDQNSLGEISGPHWRALPPHCPTTCWLLPGTACRFTA